MWRYALPLVVLTLLSLVFWRGLTLDPSEVPSPLLGQNVPSFSLPALRNPEQTVTDEDLRGQVTLFNVWGTWCPGCHDEHPQLMRLAEEEGVRIVGLNLRDERDKAIRWLDRVGDPYVMTGFDQDASVSIDWGVYGAPETFVIDARGRVRHKHIGPITDADIEDTLLPLIRRLEGGES